MTALAYVVCALVWSTTWFAIRRCIDDGGYPTFLAAALRFSIAGLLLMALYLAGGARPGPRSRRELLWLVGAGVLGGCSYGFVYLAEERISGGLAAVIYGTMPLMVAALARATGTERIRPATLAGALLGIAGIALIFWDRLEVSGEQAIAVLLMMGSVACAAVYSVIFKRHAQGHHPMASTAVFVSLTALTLWLAVGLLEREAPPSPLPVEPTLWLVYLGIIGSVVVFSSYFYLVKHTTLMTVSTLVFVQPILALVVDALFETEMTLAPRTYLGVAVTLSAIGVTIPWRARRKTVSEPELQPRGEG